MPNPSNLVIKFDVEKIDWKKITTTFDTITVNPSVDASKHGHWHGFIVNGVAN